MSISWTKEWAGPDDGTLLKGIDLGNLQSDISASISIASQAEAEAGAENTKTMTPLRVEQAVTDHLTDSPDIDTPDIDGGTIDGSTIGATTAPTVTDLGSVTTCDINGGSIDGVTIGAASAPTVTDLGSVATCDINGGTMDGVQIGGTTATGELLVNNASDDADGLGSQGTSGQLLNSAGAGANPTWGDASAFGSWASATIGSSTQVAADSMLVGYVTATGGGDADMNIKTDSASTPTTVRIDNDTAAVGGAEAKLPFCCPVKKDDYYLITQTVGTVTAFIIPVH